MEVEVVREGWDAHYRRMQRSHAKLANHVTVGPYNSEHYDDDLYHFFQDAWHLKDWIKNDPAAFVKAPNIETDLKGDAFEITADLANGTKHRKLLIEKHIRKGAAINEKERIVSLGGDPPENRWHITLSDGTKTTAEQVVEDVMKAWDVLLKSYGLS
jgi:hypothetical protein